MNQIIRYSVLIVIVCCSGCGSIQTRNKSTLTIYLAPYQVCYTTLLGASSELSGLVRDDDSLPVNTLHPQLFGVVLVNSGDSKIRIPSYSNDPIGGIALSFEIKDGGDVVRIEKKDPYMTKEDFVKIYGHESIANPMTGTTHTLGQGESVILVPRSSASWVNADEIDKRKNSKTTRIRAVYELYPWQDSGRYGVPITYYSDWVDLYRIIPFPLNNFEHCDKLVY